MSTQLSQRSSLVLLIALGLALAGGLLAAGPWQVQAQGLHYADARAWGGLPAAMNVLSSLPLALACLAGAWALRRAGDRCPAALQRPYLAFFALAGSSGGLAAVFHAAPTPSAFVAIQVLVAAGSGTLVQAYLAERVAAVWGSPPACSGVLLAACGAGLWWWVSDGDLRALVWLQALPVLLLGAGLLVLPCHYCRHGDWVVMLLAYVLSRVLEAGDDWVFGTLGFISGHSLMHLVLASVPALLARRLWLSARGGLQSAGTPSLRATSLHTAG